MNIYFMHVTCAYRLLVFLYKTLNTACKLTAKIYFSRLIMKFKFSDFLAANENHLFTEIFIE